MSDLLTIFDLSDNQVSKKIAQPKEGFTAKQLKAISWYQSTNDLRIQLCNPPMQMNFTEKSTGEPLTVTLETILDEWHEWNENDKKERARQRREEKAFQEKVKKGLV